MPAKTYRAEIKATLQVEDVGEFALSEYQSRWGLNEIPQCDAVPPVGRNAITNKVALIHKKATELGEMRKAKIVQTIKGEYADSTSWPGGEVTVFDGYLAGVGMRKMGGQAQPVISLTHWLSDLNFSSMVSQQSFTSNPYDFTFDAAGGSPGNGPVDAPAGLASLVPRNYFEVDNIIEDLWGKAIKPFLCNMCQKDWITQGIVTGNLVTGSQKNDAALAALSRIEGESGDACSLSLSPYNVPLALTVPNERVKIGEAIVDASMQIALSCLTQRTMWDFLVGAMGPNFLFSIVPCVDKALVVPFTAGLREYYKTIKDTDYDFCDFSQSNERPLKTMAIYSQSPGANGLTAGTPMVSASWSPRSVEKGMIRFIQPPSWLQYVQATAGAVRVTTGVKEKKCPNVCSAPTANNVFDLKPENDVEDAKTLTNDMFVRYAQACYVNAMLSSRMGSMSGKLRYDLSPGTTIRIDGRKEGFMSSNDQLGQDYVGTVARVSIGVNVQNGACGTGIQLAHLRRLSENENDKYSVASHVLYGPKAIYKGAPLTDGYDI